MTAKDLADKLGGKRSGRGWKCPCPAHDDKHPSLDITEGDDGRILVKCRAGCDQTAVLDALRSQGLWNGAAHDAAEGAVLVGVVPAGAPALDLRAVLREAKILRRRGEADIIVVDGIDYIVTDVVRFDVKDRQGLHLYSEARILFGWQERKGRLDKTHRPITLWRLPDGQLEWQVKGYRKPGPLYGLETLDGKPDAAVVVYEGPGKADRARGLAPGPIHLGLMGGAEKVGHTDVSDLKDRDVVLWLDADEPGEKATAVLRDRIIKAGARSIGIVTPPEGAPKGWGIDDLAEEEAAGDDVEALIAAALDAANPVPTDCQPLPTAALADFLSTKHWRQREIERPEPLLGELIVNTTRMFLGGPTGLGKTNFVMGMAGGMANATGFLHWSSSRPARVLLIDGEMSRELVQERLDDLHRRMNVEDLPNLFVFCREDAEELAKQSPGLGEMQPFNTDEGREWLLRLIDMLGGIDAVIFDNRISLLSGDMKDEVPWTDTMPLVKELTKRRIAQIWVDHTGHDAGHIYGTKTKEWSFDVVGVMTKGDVKGADIAFSLSFDPPAGKARRRKPSNRADFETATILLSNDRWTTENAQPNAPQGRPPSPTGRKFHEALINALCLQQLPGTPAGRTTLSLWRFEAVRMGLLEPNNGDRTHDNAEAATWSKYRKEVIAAGWAGVNGEYVANTKRR